MIWSDYLQGLVRIDTEKEPFWSVILVNYLLSKESLTTKEMFRVLVSSNVFANLEDDATKTAFIQLFLKLSASEDGPKFLQNSFKDLDKSQILSRPIIVNLTGFIGFLLYHNKAFDQPLGILRNLLSMVCQYLTSAFGKSDMRHKKSSFGMEEIEEETKQGEIPRRGRMDIEPDKKDLGDKGMDIEPHKFDLLSLLKTDFVKDYLQTSKAFPERNNLDSATMFSTNIML